MATTRKKPNLLRKCPCCGRWRMNIERRRRNTAFCEEYDEMNYLTSCEDCFDEDWECYTELWEEFNHGRL